VEVNVLGKSIVNREASDTYKGFRYQKLRLARKMMQLLKANKDAYIIGFPEYRDDSYILGEKDKILEQDKEYDNNFTINSKEVRKALVNFLDNYLELRKDPNLVFIFHTNVELVKERKSSMMEELKLEPLDLPVLQYLIDRNYSEMVISFVSKVILFTYKEENQEQEDVYFQQAQKMTEQDWKSFFNCIYFEFGQADINTLEEELINEIKLCPYYEELHVGRETNIKSSLLEMLDKRMKETEILKKAFNSDSLRNIFLELKDKEKILPSDPIYTAWEIIESDKETTNDIRNLREKIENICKDFNNGNINRLNLEATTAKSEIMRLDKKHRNSLKVRVYESMGKYFDDIFDYKDIYNYDELKKCISQLKETVVSEINDLKLDYNYGLSNSRIIEKLVMMLIDECFYSFDKE
jgi:hypothetical protein